jgi:hypothetical protein
MTVPRKSGDHPAAFLVPLRLFFEEIESDVADDGEILRSVA